MFYNSPIRINDENLKVSSGLKSIKDSVDSFLALLLLTPKGGLKADYDFGFDFWSNEFQNFIIKNFNNRVSDSLLLNYKGEHVDKMSCEKSLKATIEIYEPRLKNVKVEVKVEKNNKVSRNDPSNLNEIKYIVYVTISGDLVIDKLTVEDYTKSFVFSVGPVIRK